MAIYFPGCQPSPARRGWGPQPRRPGSSISNCDLVTKMFLKNAHVLPVHCVFFIGFITDLKQIWAFLFYLALVISIFISVLFFFLRLFAFFFAFRLFCIENSLFFNDFNVTFVVNSNDIIAPWKVFVGYCF